jgi:hypothetical protein
VGIWEELLRQAQFDRATSDRLDVLIAEVVISTPSSG